MKLIPAKLLALAAPAALLVASPAHADAPRAPTHEVAAAPARAMPQLAAFAAMLRAIVAAASTAPSQPLTGADGCPLPGNVGKNASMHCSLDQRTASK